MRFASKLLKCFHFQSLMFLQQKIKFPLLSFFSTVSQNLNILNSEFQIIRIHLIWPGMFSSLFVYYGHEIDIFELKCSENNNRFKLSTSLIFWTPCINPVQANKIKFTKWKILDDIELSLNLHFEVNKLSIWGGEGGGWVGKRVHPALIHLKGSSSPFR